MTLAEYKEHHDYALEMACKEPQELITQVWTFDEYPTLDSLLQNELMVFNTDDTKVSNTLTPKILNKGISPAPLYYDTPYTYDYLLYDINGNYIPFEDIETVRDYADVALMIDGDGYLQWITPAAMAKYKDIIEEY